MEPDAPTPSPADESPGQADRNADHNAAHGAEHGAEPDAERATPMFTTPVIVALLSLSGVLGGALFSNWDKIFGHHAKPAATMAATSQAPLMAAMQGIWLSPVAQHPYQPDRRFKLRLEMNTAGGELTGRVSDIAEGSSSGPGFEILSPRPVAEGIDFQVASRWCCEDGKEQAYQTFYQVRPTSQGLAVTRRNNAPGGGQVERFLLSRGD